MKKILIICFTLMFLLACIFYHQNNDMFDNSTVTYIKFWYKSNFFNSIISTENDEIYLLDNSVHTSKSDISVIGLRSSFLISHDKYIINIQKLDSIVNFVGKISDSLYIDIFIYDNGSMVKRIILRNEKQMYEYIEFIKEYILKNEYYGIPQQFDSLSK